MLCRLGPDNLADFMIKYKFSNSLIILSDFSGPFQSSLTDYITLKGSKTKKAVFANSLDLDEVAHYEPPHLDLHYLPSCV